MALHIFLRPKNKPTINSVQKAGSIQFNKYHGSNLQAVGTATCWWKQKFLQANADIAHSVVTINTPPNTFARLFSFGFSVEIVKNNTPIYYSEFAQNASLNNGFYLRLNLEAIQSPRPECQTPLAAIFTRHPGLYPSRQEIYSN